MKGFSCPAKIKKECIKGKRFDVGWEPLLIELPSDYS